MTTSETLNARNPQASPITHVAIRYNGEIYSLPKPNRHGHVIQMICETLGIETVTGINGDRESKEATNQGFLCADGKYWTRRQAYIIAKENGQILPARENRVVKNWLTSEDVW